MGRDPWGYPRCCPLKVKNGKTAPMTGWFVPNVPRGFLDRIGRLPGKACLVGLHVWRQHRIHKGGPAPLSSKSLKEFGVSREAKRHALAALEEAGLIKVERTDHGSPLVTVTWGSGDQTAGQAGRE